jgi:4'-phosphopantetheinyl transferase
MRYDNRIPYMMYMMPFMNNIFKKLHPTNCIIQDSRIDIWEYPLHTEFIEARSLLNEAELARADRYHFAHHQRRFTVARAVLRLILARYLQLPPSELVFTYNKHGKPELLDSVLQFNLSHSGDTALLAIGQTYPLGIDLEFFSARSYEGIGSHLFSINENKALSQVSNKLKPLVFFNIWAQKEALIKACGLGLSYPTKQFDVPILPGESVEIIDSLHEKTWQMISFMPQMACSAALCHHPLIKNIHYLKVEKLTSLLSIFQCKNEPEIVLRS